ncbi:S8 family peptidase [Paenibacillus alkalitolerans]|uniref:S8 family peptidase n=1 Tax=Paenibacillus alkalitolerans TaxID=2799335 RepID=UPI001F429BDE|nr:S8 family peptidase [Paenibacillus alkalitolerans]
MRNRRITLGIIVGLLALALPVGMFLSNPQDIPPPAPIAGTQDEALDRNAGVRQQSVRQPAGTVWETQSKQRLLSTDVAATNALCRSQCRIDLQKMTEHMNGAGQARLREHLRQMRKEHPHMERLEWIDPNVGKSIAAGSIPEPVRKKAAPLMKSAKASVLRGQTYESNALEDTNGDKYFVLGVPSRSDPRGGIVGLVHQDILRKVADHQIRNLRIKPFPDERKRFGIRAYDPNTGKEMDVDTAEENKGVSHYIRKEVVVRFQEEPSEERLREISNEIGAVNVKKLGYAYVFESRHKSTKDMMKYFQTMGVQYVEPHYLYVTNETDSAAPIIPNDDLYSRYQWNLPIIQTPGGWQLTRGNDQVTVAVIDTGVDMSHPDLQGRLAEGYNVIDSSKPPEDDVGHGTHVAGVISALTDNREGVAGMTWYNRIMPVKVLDSSGMGSTYAVAEGIIWATDHGARVINLSLGNYASAQFLHDAIRYAFDRDVVIVAATGNDNTSQPGYPAAYEEVFGVSATNANREKASFSNYGGYVDVVAPGENIASTYTNHQYAALSGTSMASPHTAALAALIRSVNSQLKNTEVYDIMRQSAEDLGAQGRDDYFGYGQIHVQRALQLAAGVTPNANADEQAEKRTFGGTESIFDWLWRLITGDIT